MKQSRMRLLTRPSKKSSIHEVNVKGKTVIKYDDKIAFERRRPLVGRPSGTECGDSCTCS